MASKVVAVTGASGFIGAHVVLALLRRGYTVHACVRNKDDAKNKFLLELGGPVRLFSALLLDEGAYDAAFAGAVGVIHVAAVLAIAAQHALRAVSRTAAVASLTHVLCRPSSSQA